MFRCADFLNQLTAFGQQRSGCSLSISMKVNALRFLTVFPIASSMADFFLSDNNLSSNPATRVVGSNIASITCVHPLWQHFYSRDSLKFWNSSSSLNFWSLDQYLFSFTQYSSNFGGVSTVLTAINFYSSASYLGIRKKKVFFYFGASILHDKTHSNYNRKKILQTNSGILIINCSLYTQIKLDYPYRT